MNVAQMLAVTAVAISLDASATARATGQLLVTGSFIEEFVNAVPEGSWHALCPNDHGFAIRTAMLTIRPAQPIDLGDGPVPMKDVRAAGCAKPLVLMRVGELEEGDVATVFSGNEEIGRDAGKELQLGPSKYALFARDSEPETREIIVRFGGIEQQIAVVQGCCNDAQPTLLWAGDLDGDGKLDLLLNVTMHYAHSELALFLSSRATGGELLRDVARFASGSC